jgi:hypothetical protein
LGFVDPILEKAARGYVAGIIAKDMQALQEAHQSFIVFPQLTEHVLWRHIIRTALVRTTMNSKLRKKSSFFILDPQNHYLG